MSAAEPKKRQVNFELLRILCMYMIVIGHCLFHGRVTAKLGYGTVNYFLSYLVQSFSAVHVNCFVMIGGYFAIDRVFRAERVLKLWKQVLFYSIVIALLAGSVQDLGIADLVKACFPISAKNYWFASVYMGLLVLMPFLRILCRKMTKRQYQWLLLALAVFMSINPMIFRTETYGIFSGRELPWFVFLALLAGYVKIHIKEDKRYVLLGLAGYVGASLAILASVYLSVELHWENNGYFLNYNSPLALLATFSLFTAVRNLSWKETKLDGIILKIASAAFGVYLIHDHYLLRYPVWDLFRASKVARTHWAVIYAALAALIVYFACTVLELLRQQLSAAFSVHWQRTVLYKKEQHFCNVINAIIEESNTEEGLRNE